MRAFVNNQFFPILFKIFEQLHVKTAYITYVDEKQPVPEGVDPHYINWDKAMRDADYGVDWNTIDPIDETLLFSLAKCEIIALKMMERKDWFQEFNNYDFRKTLYLKNVRYWNHILNHNSIDFAIFDTVPHEIFDYILWQMCELKGIPIILIFQGQIGDTMLFYDNYDDPFIDVRENYTDLVKENKSEAEIVLEGKFRENYFNHIDITQKPTPFYTVSDSHKHSITRRIGVIWDVWRKYSLKQAYRVFYLAKFERSLFKYYDSLAIEPDLTKKYVFVGLHYQPEMTTSPMGGVYVNQELIIQMLGSIVPDDVLIYVKEHPWQRQIGRNRNFYKEISKIRNVKIVPRFYNSTVLMDHSLCVVTITGTIGLEALFRKIPIIAFGPTFYQYIEGCYRVHTIEDVRKAIKIIIEKKVDITNLALKRLMKALEIGSVRGYIEPTHKAYTALTDEQNIENISSAIIKRVKKILSEKDKDKKDSNSR